MISLSTLAVSRRRDFGGSPCFPRIRIKTWVAADACTNQSLLALSLDLVPVYPRVISKSSAPLLPSAKSQGHYDFYTIQQNGYCCHLRPTMAFLSSMLSTLGYQHPPGSRPAAPGSSSPGERAQIPLPPELIVNIANFLPLESAASLSICCRSTFSAIGTQCLEALRDKPSDCYNFLTLLESQLHSYVLCYYCEKLHSITKAHRHVKSCYSLSSKNYLRCWTSHHELETEYFIHSDFSFTVFQMTVKYHRLGNDCSELLNLLSMKATTYLHYGYVERRAVSAKIVSGSLFLRDRRIFMIPSDRPRPVPWDLLVALCPHFRKLSTSSFDQQGDIVLPNVAQWDIPEQHRNELVQCKHCMTEFKISFRSFGKRGNAMFITRWLDLGQGKSALDPEWQRHVRGIEVRGRSPAEWPLVFFDRGSICAAFGQDDDMVSDSETVLSSQDEQELFRTSPYSWPRNI